MSAAAVAGLVFVIATLIGLIASSLHYALLDFSIVKLEALLGERRNRKGVDAVLDDLPGHVAASGALRVVCNVVIAVSAVVMLGVFSAATAPEPHVVVSGWRLTIALILASVFIYLFGVAIPVSIAEHAGERLMVRLAGPLRMLGIATTPLRWMRLLDTAIKRLAGVAHISEAEEAEDEILSAVSEGEREGSIGEEEREMIEGVVELRSQTVEQVMTPRTEIEGFELTNDLKFIREFIEKAGHSRIPVFEGDLDHIVGILYAKDLLQYLGRDTDGFSLKDVLRTPVWVPESKPVSDTLVELRARKVHLAIVLDEYGGTTGLVTFEDILEEIVGEIHDEFEPEDEGKPAIALHRDERAAEVDARAYINDVNDELSSIGIEIPEGEGYDTIGGFVLDRLGHIPVAGEFVEAEGFALAVLGAEPTRITRLRIEARQVEESAPSNNGAAKTETESSDISAPDRSAQRAS